MNGVTATANPQYSFDVVQNGDTYSFTYKRSKYGIKLFLILSAILGIPVFLYFVLHGNGVPLSVFLALIIPSIFFGLLNVSRKGGSFTIDPTQVTVNGKGYERSHIHEIYRELPKKYQDNSRFAPKGNVQQLREETRLAILDQAAAKNFIIGFVYGEKHIKLAGGLTETSADVLYRKLTDILKLNK